MSKVVSNEDSGEHVLGSSEETLEPVILTTPSAQDEPQVDVGKAARQGSVWAVLGYGVSKVFGFAASIVLARLLIPNDYGLIAMVNTVLGIVQVVGNWGIGAAVIQQKDNVEDYANTAWWLDICIGISLFVISNVCSPLAASFYHEPRVRLIIFVASINYLINPVGSLMDTLLRRKMRLTTCSKINLLCGCVGSLLTILMAFMGAGVWSFVYPSIISGIIGVVMRWRMCSFRPKLKVNWGLSHKIIGFGKYLLGAGIFDWINTNIDFVLVGALMGTKQLGYYLFAYNLGVWIVANISSIISSVLFPTISSINQDEDRARAMFLKIVQIICLVGFPIVAIQCVLAHTYITDVYGEKWAPSVTAFRFIAIYAVGRAVCAPALILISAMGRPDINFKASAATAPILVAAIFVGSKYGINGVAMATAIAHGTLVWLYVLIPFKILRWNMKTFFSALLPAFTCSVIAAGAVSVFVRVSPTHSKGLLTLAIMIAVGVIIYLLALDIFFPRTLNMVRKQLRSSIADGLG